MKIFKNIEQVSDKKSLYESLSENSLEIIDSVLEAYNKVEIEPIKFDYAEQYCENNYEGIVDFLSSKTGWCVKSCRVTQVINGNTTTEV